MRVLLRRSSQILNPMDAKALAHPSHVVKLHQDLRNEFPEKLYVLSQIPDFSPTCSLLLILVTVSLIFGNPWPLEPVQYHGTITDSGFVLACTSVILSSSCDNHLQGL